ncbi:molybdopterin converting factor subunit 1 [Thiosulfativibrio zosterae]|uniref:Molybdopterin synthase sulfur carrier subunit n=1 Tax=Thiosulfativibrio zosterae TaxID=2675053 RepID=A0A6F8PQH8_9GAMM|nr:molybdopterin converting factor subunit 1 [Thiosulfativibrio zosterae]BBP44336.1 molybdopterin synthase sulfur carrier subunit [Thiosulfativibrio zosterae]
MIEVLYFASFREVLGQSQESLPAEHGTIQGLLEALGARGESWREALLENQNLQIALNHDITHRHAQIKAGDEIAFFPPVTGG